LQACSEAFCGVYSFFQPNWQDPISEEEEDEGRGGGG